MKTIGTCKDCRNWKEDKETEYYGTCKGIVSCDLEPIIDKYNNAVYLFLETNSDFGCIKWEGKNG